MEGEIVAVTAAKDNGGIHFLNLNNGSIYSQQMKNCLCPSQGIIPLS
jgi:hypothetical protein